MKSPFKLEAVTTCVGYADFLAHTLPLNRHLFDQLVVVTAPEDKATQRLCEYWNVRTVLTDRFGSNWDRFDKAKGLNEGLKVLAKDAWLLHLDADIALPPLARNILAGLDLDPLYLYGLDRFMCPSYAEWQRFLCAPRLMQEDATWMHLSAFDLGVRVMSSHQYVPIGYAQLWHAASGIVCYPEDRQGAAATDMQFALQWPRNRRGFIPEIVVYHLESEKAPMGHNWNGRKTKKFDPECGGADYSPTG